jgi:hypothetical protein
MPRSHPVFKLSVFLTATLLLLLWTVPASRAAGQIDGTEWTTPVNLSQSGAAGDVVAVEDSEGIIHVLWRDTIAGFIYARSEDQGWTVPAAVQLPFVAELTEQQGSAGMTAELFVPKLRADTNGHIHAFWRNEEATLLHSAVPAGSFTETSSWSGAKTVAEGVLDAAITVDDAGTLHLVYIQSQDSGDSPSGIYYRRSDNGAVSWTPAAALEHSAYFRSLPLEQANLDVATTTIGEGGRVIVVWDLPPREKVFVIQSDDNGQTWREPREVDRRRARDTETAVGPSGILVATAGSEVHLTWQAGHDGARCSQYHQWSPDGGDSWEEPQLILEELLVCPNANSFVMGQDDRLLLLATVAGNVQGGVYLAAWNGAYWSELREQAPLSSFINPETLRPVTLSCRRELLVAEQLMVVGCSSGDVQDVWLLTRPVGDLAHWFREPSPWEVAPVLATAANEIQFSVVVPDLDGRVHVVWTEGSSDVINYLLWDGLRWSSSFPILTSPTGVVDRPVAVLTPDRRLFLMWNDVESGQIYYSQTGADRALYAEDWIAPRQLPVQRDGATSVDVLVDGEGVIYVAFAVPINEGRGIYLIRSDDLAESWSEPALIFDAVTSQWAMVDRPQLALTDSGHLHVLWTRYSRPANAQPQALMYARSLDEGQSWSEPQIVVQAPLLWSRITGAAENRIHRHWQEVIGGRAMVWQETTADNGSTWSYTNLAANTAMAGTPGLAEDAAGHLHLVYEEGSRLHYRLWNGERWAQAEGLALGRTAVSDVSTLAVAVTGDRSLALVFAGRAERKSGTGSDQTGNVQQVAGEQPFVLQFARQPLDYPDPAPEVTTAAVVTSETSVVPTASPSPSPEPAAAPVENSGRQESAASLLNSLTLQMIVAAALLPAGLLIVLVLVLGIRRTRQVG